MTADSKSTAPSMQGPILRLSFSSSTMMRLDELMTRNNEGTLSDVEREELRALVVKAEQITLENARLLGDHERPLESKTTNDGNTT